MTTPHDAPYSAAPDIEELQLLEAEVELKEGLPHLHGFPWYEWAWDFFTTTNPMAFLCAANQISKSSTQIRKCIDWATDTKKWRTLWPKPGLPPPNQFWYVYPTAPLATVEFETKWRRDFLPRGKYETSKEYGWKAHYKNKEIDRIEFNTGCTVYFKSYKQGGFNLQSATVYAIFLDEECPYELWDEFVFRLHATDGYLSMVFTATLGQEEWKQVIEPADESSEKYPDAWKRQVSVFECQTYMDGSPGPWPLERINRAIAKCSSPAQVQRRILGKFVKESGLIYGEFATERHMIPWSGVPTGWFYYIAADIGSGREERKGQGHPGGIVVVAVRPDYQTGRVVYAWRGDNQRTTAGDIYNKAEEIIRELDIVPLAKLYDWGSADFGTISNRAGGGWRPANKNHDEGEQAVNTLFKHDMLFLFQKGEVGKLAGELSSVNHEQPKRKRKDDLCFVAGTSVATDTGPRNIEDIAVGDLVLTRNGLRRVLVTMNRSKPVKEYRFASGERIKCTPQHKFFTKEHGFKAIDDLIPSDTLLTIKGWRSQKLSFLTESNLEDTHILKEGTLEIITGALGIIGREGFLASIKKYGSRLMDRFLPNTESITLTATRSIIESRIYNAFRYQHTHPSTQKSESERIQNNTASTLEEPERLPRSGIDRRRGSPGTPKAQERSAKIDHCETVYAKFAEKPSKLKLFKKQLNTAIKIVRHALLENATVYNITVEGDAEYFANGILASNCDPLRYICIEIPWDWTVIREGIQKDGVWKKTTKKMTPDEQNIADRRGEMSDYAKQEDELEAEFDEINSLYAGQ